MTNDQAKKKLPLALLADNDPGHNKTLATVLKKLGIDAIVTTTAKEFLLKLKEVRPNICIVDLNIDSLGIGYTLIRAIRNVLGRDLPIVVISGQSDSKAIAHAVECGADDFISKPLDKTILASKLTRYLMTEQLLASQAPFFPVPEGGTPANISLEMELKEVDEFGIKLVSPHLLNKGSVFQMDSPLLHQITGSAQPHLLTITATWLEDETGNYAAFAEFDATNEALLTSVRRWLSQKH